MSVAFASHETVRVLARPVLQPELAAGIYRILGDSYSTFCEHVKGLKLLEQARALAVEAARPTPLVLGLGGWGGEVCSNVGTCHQRQSEHEDWWLRRAVLGEVCNSLGTCHSGQGEHEKAIAEYEQARAIAVELGRREYEQARACNGLGLRYQALNQYDKAIELFEALDLAVQKKVTNCRMEVQIHLACVATLKGDENEWMMKVLQRRAPEDGAEWRG